MRDWEAVCESGKVLRVRCRQWRGGINVRVVDWDTDYNVPREDDDVEAVARVVALHSGERVDRLRTPRT